jgi:actin-like ATPase involved in cell morphogenesis
VTYALGVDLGTTYSAAAVHRGDRPRIVELGVRSASIPSVVFLRDDGTMLSGDAAQRRAAGEPRRVAREFKRRIGDPTPILLGGSPYSAEALSGRLLRWIVDHVAEREGGAPHAITVTHPANWGPYKTDLLEQAVRLAGLGSAVLLTEPEAAVRHYASQERVEVGSVIAVYDLGGGTFDAAILRKAEIGFEPLGRPEGIERLGGIDFDAAVVDHVMRSLDGMVDDLEGDSAGALQALARLRQECVDAKEALSSDTDVSIPVSLPNVQTEVRLTRAEFEAMIRPSLTDSLDAMRRALASADVTPDEVTAVLLVGGSSRIPLVAQLVSNEFGRPVAIDADPKHAIALGAALMAAEQQTPVGATAPAVHAVHRPEPEPVVDVRQEPEAAHVGPAADDEPTAQQPVAAATAPMPAVGNGVGSAAGAPPARSRTPLLVGVGCAVLLALIGGIIVARGSGGGSPDEAEAAAVTSDTTAGSTGTNASPITAGSDPVDTATPAAATPPATTDVTATPATADAATAGPTTAVAPTTTVALVSPCPVGPERTACITDLAVDADGGLVATYVVTGYEPELDPPSQHIHFYFDSVVGDDERNAGSEGSGGDWRLWDTPNPFTATGGDQGRTGYTLADAEAVGATQLCSLVATATHAVFPGTGNCIDLPST